MFNFINVLFIFCYPTQYLWVPLCTQVKDSSTEYLLASQVKNSLKKSYRSWNISVSYKHYKRAGTTQVNAVPETVSSRELKKYNMKQSMNSRIMFSLDLSPRYLFLFYLYFNATYSVFLWIT